MARRTIRTYLDSRVLITAYNAGPELKEPALRVLEDPDRFFLCSPFVHLETTPKALFNKRRGERRFYQMYFRHAAMTNDLKLILGHGFREAARAGVGPMDALHLASGISSEEVG